MRKYHLHRWLLLSLLFSIFIQVVGITFLIPVDNYDSKEYLSISRNLFNGNGYAVSGTSFKKFKSFQGEIPTRMRQPLYPLYLVLFYWTLGENLLTIQISQIILNVLSFIFIFLIAHKIFGDNLWSGTLIGLGLYFPLWLTSAFVGTESLFIILLALFMFLFQKAIYSEKLILFILSGVVLGCAFLTRPITLLVCPLCLIPILFYNKLSKAIVNWSVLLIAFFIVLSPWFIRNAIVLGDYTFLSTEGGYVLWCGSSKYEHKWFESQEVREAVQNGYYIDRKADKRFKRMAIENIKKDSIGVFKRGLLGVTWVWSYFPGSQQYRNNNLVFLIFSFVQCAILIFALLGLLFSKCSYRAYLLLPAISFSIILIFAKGISRYIVPAMPFVLILSGQGFYWLKQKILRFILLRQPIRHGRT